MRKYFRKTLDRRVLFVYIVSERRGNVLTLTHNGTMPAFLHHVYNRAMVPEAKFRFGRPNF